MRVARACGDDSSETRLVEVEVPDGRVPAVVLQLGSARPRPFHDFHPAPARGFVTALRGEFEIGTTNGDRRRFGPGEWFFADDVGTRGHTTECFGEAPHLLHCEVPEDWNGWEEVASG
jgi:hypothetical protein